MAHATARSITLLVCSLIRLQYKHVFEGCPSVRRVSSAVTPGVQLRSSVLREVWELVTDSPSMATNTSHENSVLSGEKTYDLDLDAVRELPVTAGACLSEFVSDRGGESLEAWGGA
jgi:hypothetical protein